MKENTYEWGDGVFTLLSWFKKDKVKNARVLVAGAGALGNEVVKNLALFGVGHIYVCDFDRIEITNLTRSVLFREEDARNHSYKADIVAKRAREINPQIEVTPIVGNLFSEVGLGLYQSVDVIIGCLDSRIARYQLNRLAMRTGKTWIDGSIENLTGTVNVYAPGINCYECGLSREDFNNIMLRTGCADVVRTQTASGRVATTPVSASIVGAMQVQEAMKVIHTPATVSKPATVSEASASDSNTPAEKLPFTTLVGKMWHFEGMTNRFMTYRHASWHNNCPAHEQWTNIIKAHNLSANNTVATVLEQLKQLLGANAVEINMRNNKFIEKIISDRPEKEFNVMIPESQLDDYINSNEELRKLNYRTLFHKCFHENIDEYFPYQEMTLKQVGIPLFDIIQVSTDKGMFFVELSADALKEEHE